MTISEKRAHKRRIIRKELREGVEHARKEERVGPARSRAEELMHSAAWKLVPAKQEPAPEMRTVERLTADCLQGRHQYRGEDGRLHGCVERCLGNDAATRMGNNAGEKVRVRCTCDCHKKLAGQLVGNA